MRMLFLLMLCVSLSLANEYKNKTIIKMQKEEVQIIDLQQSSIDEKPLYNSSQNRAKGNALANSYKDTRADFALISGFSSDFSFDYTHFSIPPKLFASELLAQSLSKIKEKKNLELLNKQHNMQYENFLLFNKFNNKAKRKGLQSSVLLDFQALSNKIYAKKPEFVLFLGFDEFYIDEKKIFFLFNQRVAKAKVALKILNLKTNTIVSRTLNFEFSVNDAQPKELYDLSLQRLSNLLSEFLTSKNLAQFTK